MDTSLHNGHLSILDDSYRPNMDELYKEISQLQRDYQNEQEMVIMLRKALNEVETRELQKTTEANKKINELTAECARAWSCVEKGEAARRDLELGVVQQQQHALQEESGWKARVEQQEEINANLKRELADLREELTDIQRQGQSHQELCDTQRQVLQEELNEKTQQVSKLEAERDVYRAGKSHLDAALQQKEVILRDLTEKLEEVKVSNKTLSDEQRRIKTELDYCINREERFKKDYVLATERIQSLENNIEVERANHLETKFNAELVQLGVKDLEGVVSVEKSARTEASKAVDRVTKQLEDLERVYNECRKKSADLKDRNVKLEKEVEDMKGALSAELADKKKMAKNLSQQLDEHQMNFNELKDELAKSRKRLVTLEDNYSGSMKELEQLIHKFNLTSPSGGNKNTNNSSPATAPAGTKSTKFKTTKDVTRRSSSRKLLDSLQATLIDYKKLTDSSKTELLKATNKVSHLSKEVQSLKHHIALKDQTIDDTQTSHTKTAKDLTKLRADYTQLERLLTNMASDLKSSTDSQNRDKSQTQQLSDALTQLTNRTKMESLDKLQYLQSLYDRLTTILPDQQRNAPISDPTWHDMSVAVSEHVTRIMQHVSSMQYLMEQTKGDLGNKERRLVDLQQEHNDQVIKLSNQLREREDDLHKQKFDLEQHYTQIIADLQSRSTKQQTQADEAWQKMQASGTTQEILDAQCAELRSRVAQMTRDNASLLSASALLAGALFPLHSRVVYLSSQRRMLLAQMEKWEAFKMQTCALVTTLNSELLRDIAVPRAAQRSALLRFRVAAIAIIAANRMRNLHLGSTRIFVASDVIHRHINLPVACGQNTATPRSFTGVSSAENQQAPSQEAIGKNTYDWLSSNDLQATILTSMLEIQNSMASVDAHDGRIDYSTVNISAQRSFVRLMERISPFFQRHLERPLSGLRNRRSLIRRLQCGVQSAIADLPLEKRGALFSLQETTVTVQRHLLDMTRQLEVNEQEKQRASSKLEQMTRVTSELADSEQRVKELQKDMKRFLQQNPSGKSVDAKKYRDACEELSNALTREQKLQGVLAEQSEHMSRLMQSLETETKTNRHTHESLAKLKQDLGDARVEARHKDSALMLLREDSAAMLAERERDVRKLRDADNALLTAARDKKVLASYIDGISSALNQFQATGQTQRSLSDIISLQPKLIPVNIGKAGPELIACQNMVAAFIETYRKLQTEQKSFQQTTKGKDQEIASLRQQLGDMLLKTYGADHATSEKASVEKVSSSDSLADRFSPMREDSEHSYPVTTVPSCEIQNNVTDRHEDLSTPVMSTRPFSARPQTTGATSSK